MTDPTHITESHDALGIPPPGAGQTTVLLRPIETILANAPRLAREHFLAATKKALHLAPVKPKRKPRKPPTLASVAKQASKAGIEVARYEVNPDGTVVVVTGTPAPAEQDNPWPLDEFRTKETKQ